MSKITNPNVWQLITTCDDTGAAMVAGTSYSINSGVSLRISGKDAQPTSLGEGALIQGGDFVTLSALNSQGGFWALWTSDSSNRDAWINVSKLFF